MLGICPGAERLALFPGVPDGGGLANCRSIKRESGVESVYVGSWRAEVVIDLIVQVIVQGFDGDFAGVLEGNGTIGSVPHRQVFLHGAIPVFLALSAEAKGERKESEEVF